MVARFFGLTSCAHRNPQGVSILALSPAPRQSFVRPFETSILFVRFSVISRLKEKESRPVDEKRIRNAAQG